MTEYESERERIATIYDLRITLLDAENEGKHQYTTEEILAILDDYVRSIKQHK